MRRNASVLLKKSDDPDNGSKSSQRGILRWLCEAIAASGANISFEDITIDLRGNAIETRMCKVKNDRYFYGR
jgi:hypothetical protein